MILPANGGISIAQSIVLAALLGTSVIRSTLKYNVGLTLAQFDELIRLINDEPDLDEDMLLEIRDNLAKTRAKLRERLANPPVSKKNPGNRIKGLGK